MLCMPMCVRGCGRVCRCVCVRGMLVLVCTCCKQQFNSICIIHENSMSVANNDESLFSWPVVFVCKHTPTQRQTHTHSRHTWTGTVWFSWMLILTHTRSHNATGASALRSQPGWVGVPIKPIQSLICEKRPSLQRHEAFIERGILKNLDRLWCNFFVTSSLSYDSAAAGETKSNLTYNYKDASAGVAYNRVPLSEFCCLNIIRVEIVTFKKTAKKNNFTDN